MKMKEAYKEILFLIRNFDKLSDKEIIGKGVELAEQLTQSESGFFHLVNEDQKHIKPVKWSGKTKKCCQIPNLSMEYAIEKAGVWTDCFYTRKPVIFNDYPNLKHKKGLPEGHFPLKRVLTFPLIDKDKVVSILGVGNKQKPYNDSDIEILNEISTNIRNLLQRKWQEKKLHEKEAALIRNNEELTKAKELAESRNANINAILKNTEDSIWAIDTNYNITYINPTFRNEFFKSFGVKLSVEHRILDFLPKEIRPKWKQRYDRAFKGERFSFEDKVQVQNNQFVYIEVSMNPIKKNNKVIGVSLFGRNITEKKHGQKELLKAKEKAEESDRLKTAFLHNISHEVRTPMNAICGFSNYLNRDDKSKEKKRQYVGIIQKSTNQLLNIIENIITAALIETDQFEIETIEFNPNDLLFDLYQSFSDLQKQINKTHIKLSLKTLPNQKPINIKSDYSHIKQILTILLDNALKFTDKGEIKFGAKIESGKLIFFVKDTGIGISEAKKEIIFKSFSQADDSIRQVFGGIGLGLTIAKGVSKLLGGQLKLESQKAIGTEAKFIYPLKETKITQTGTKTFHKKNSPTILIVEDENLNYLFIKELLIYETVNTLHAIEGDKAVEYVKKGNIDLVLMDIKLPNRSGIEVAEEIRKIDKDIPIIIQTAYANKREECAKAGFPDFIVKPYSEEKILKLIEKYIV